MSYIEAFEKAGATVHDSKWFGSYQGDVIADVTYGGRRGILVFGYGSCGGCDNWASFEGYSDREACDAHAYDAQESCVLCTAAKLVWEHEVIKFGEDYLNGIMFEDDELARYRARLVEDTEWDLDAQEQLRYFDERVALIRKES